MTNPYEVETIDLNNCIKAHFQDGDGIWLNIKDDCVLVFRGRDEQVNLVEVILRKKPHASGIVIDPFFAPSKLDDFTGVINEALYGDCIGVTGEFPEIEMRIDSEDGK